MCKTLCSLSHTWKWQSLSKITSFICLFLSGYESKGPGPVHEVLESAVPAPSWRQTCTKDSHAASNAQQTSKSFPKTSCLMNYCTSCRFDHLDDDDDENELGGSCEEHSSGSCGSCCHHGHSDEEDDEFCVPDIHGMGPSADARQTAGCTDEGGAKTAEPKQALRSRGDMASTKPVPGGSGSWPLGMGGGGSPSSPNGQAGPTTCRARPPEPCSESDGDMPDLVGSSDDDEEGTVFNVRDLLPPGTIEAIQNGALGKSPARPTAKPSHGAATSGFAPGFLTGKKSIGDAEGHRSEKAKSTSGKAHDSLAMAKAAPKPMAGFFDRSGSQPSKAAKQTSTAFSSVPPVLNDNGMPRLVSDSEEEDDVVNKCSSLPATNKPRLGNEDTRHSAAGMPVTAAAAGKANGWSKANHATRPAEP